MFGRFVLSLLLSLSAFAAQMGTVTVQEAYIYLKPDFDASIIATVKRGETFQISSKTVGPFYKIRLNDKRLGWISSIDITPGVLDIKAALKKEKENREKPLESYTTTKKALKTFGILRYQGFFIQSLDWREKTLGKTRQDNLLFYGWNWTGFDTLIKGPFYLDTRVMASFQAPGYYEKVTGVRADGLILKAQTAFVSANPLGEDFLFHYGLGLSSTFSHFKAGVLEAGEKTSYNMDDLTVGVVVPIGFSFRIGPVSTQAFYQYYLEETQTAGFSLGLNWAF